MLKNVYSDKIDNSRVVRAQGGYANGVKSKKLDFAFYLRALTRYKRSIALITAVVAVAAIYFAHVATPIYAAKATLLLEPQNANIVSIEDLVSSEQDSLDYYGTQIAILRSRALAQRVTEQLEFQENISQAQFAEMLAPSTLKKIINGLTGSIARLGLTGDPEAVDGATATTGSLEGAELNDLLSKFSDSLRINPMVKTKLVSVVFESTDPEFSALVANAVAAQYIESASIRRQAIKDSATDWMDSRITTLKTKLDDSENALLAFKIDNGLVEINGGVGRLNEQELLLSSSELAIARSELSDASDLYRKVTTFRSSAPQMLETLPFIQNDQLVRSVKTEIGQTQRVINELRNRYGAKHPTIIDAESRLQSLRSTLGGHIKRAISTFENDLQLLQQRVASLQANIVQGKENIQLIGQKQVTLEALEREVVANRDQYNRMFDRITETRITDGLDEANALVSESAWVQTQPVKPNKILLVGLAVLISLMLSALVSFIIEFLDDTVNNTDDIEQRLKTKLLGVLPLDVFEASDIFAEAVNTCRTSLRISNDTGFKVLLVTSSIPDEGKSTAALNLANSFGQIGRTLLIDCDLRKPSIAQALDMPPVAFGLSSVLLQKTSAQIGVRRNIMNSFDCLTSGPIPDQPLEMLSSERFAKVLAQLRQDYDTIIIDSPPTHAVSDALVLSKLADSVLYIVKPYSTPIKLIHSGITRLVEAGASSIGVCISQVDVQKTMSYGGMEFHGFGIDYNGYGKYYSYSDTQKKRSKTRLKSKVKEMSKYKARMEQMKAARSSDDDPGPKLNVAN